MGKVNVEVKFSLAAYSATHKVKVKGKMDIIRSKRSRPRSK